MKTEMVRVRLLFQPGEDGRDFGSETLWATPLEAHEHEGLFRLENTAAGAPLRIGDVVTAEIDGSSFLQVTGLVSLIPGVMTVVRHPMVPDSQISAVTEVWRARG